MGFDHVCGGPRKLLLVVPRFPLYLETSVPFYKMLGRCLRISDKQVLRSVVQGLPWLVLFLNFDLRHNLVRHVLNAVKGVCGLVGGPGPQWHNVSIRFMLFYHIGLFCVQ